MDVNELKLKAEVFETEAVQAQQRLEFELAFLKLDQARKLREKIQILEASSTMDVSRFTQGEFAHEAHQS